MIKTVIRKVFGQRCVSWLKKCNAYLRALGRDKIVTSNKFDIYAMPDKHVFFGYYDVPQFSIDEKMILAHVISVKAVAGRDSADVGYFLVGEKKFHKIGETKAWSWQQGARLRWNSINKDQVIYNDVENGKYVCRVYDINKHELVNTYESAFYDINRDFTYGLTLDFTRLQRLRPGYGYSNLQEENDMGIDLVDIESGKRRHLVRLSELARDIPDSVMYEHYINHVSIAPDGLHFIFFHLMNPKSGGHWITRLIIFDLVNNEYKVLEDEYIVSHYCWKDSETILVTCCDKSGNESYILYDINEGKKCTFAAKHLKRDGHPSYVGEHIISDTYPDGDSIQTLFWGFDTKAPIDIAKVFHYPFMTGEKRCDLHPRISPSHKFVCFDTMAIGRKRCCCIIRL